MTARDYRVFICAPETSASQTFILNGHCTVNAQERIIKLYLSSILKGYFKALYTFVLCKKRE